jgi:hypothetical protein
MPASEYSEDYADGFDARREELLGEDIVLELLDADKELVLSIAAGWDIRERVDRDGNGYSEIRIADIDDAYAPALADTNQLRIADEVYEIKTIDRWGVNQPRIWTVAALRPKFRSETFESR